MLAGDAGYFGAMSEENVELVRRIYDAWDREESARDFIAADVEYVNPSLCGLSMMGLLCGSAGFNRTEKHSLRPGWPNRHVSLAS